MVGEQKEATANCSTRLLAALKENSCTHIQRLVFERTVYRSATHNQHTSEIEQHFQKGGSGSKHSTSESVQDNWTPAVDAMKNIFSMGSGIGFGTQNADPQLKLVQYSGLSVSGFFFSTH
ncbi:uncharacterized protein ACIB01_001319 isoform 1-T1 [Guaruba guarouba]